MSDGDQGVFQPVASWPQELQPRERLLQHGPAALNDAELLAIILRTGTRGRTVLDLARQALTRAGGIEKLYQLHHSEWAELPGIGPGKAATILAALELGRRTMSRTRPGDPLSTPAAAAEYLRPRFHNETRETLWIIGLDAKNVPVVESIVGQGTADRAPAHPREVFAPLLRAGALKGVLSHNHPSGDPEPSSADISLTRKMIEAGNILGIPIVDHIIIANDQHISLREMGHCD